MSGVTGGRAARSKGHDSGPVLLSELLERLMIHVKKPSTDVLSTVFKSWPTIVGADVARHCRPVSIDADCLVVEADDPIWAEEIGWHSEMVLQRIADMSKTRKLDELRVRVGYHRS